MATIDGLIGILGRLESERIEVHEERCVLVRNRNADCLKCANSCSSGAISLKDGEFVIEQDKCIGCGTCATVCPTCAIEIKNPSDAEFMQRVKSVISSTNGHPVFACERALENERKKSKKGLIGSSKLPYDESKICAMPCLGRLDEAVLVGVGAYGSYDATLVRGECENCSHRAAGEASRLVAASAKSLLGAFGCGMPLVESERLPESVLGEFDPISESAGMGRREFFEKMREEAKTAVGEAAVPREEEEPTYPKVGPNGALPQFLPERRTRLYNYLLHIGEPVVESIESRVIGSVTIDSEACDSCRMCGTFCPTGALSRIDSEERFGLMHRPCLCVQCGTCSAICRNGAIRVEPKVPSGQFVGKKAVVFEMEKPDWEPSKPDSMFKKVHAAIGSDLQMCMF